MVRQRIVYQITTAIEGTGADPGHYTIADFVRITGSSRSTLYRIFGSREGIVAALADAGVDAGERSTARDAAIEAAHSIVQEQGIQHLTLDAVAARAGVALPTVYGAFRNRSGLMRAMFTRYSPIPEIAGTLPPSFPETSPDFESMIRGIYHGLWEFLEREHRMVLAIVAEVLREPHGEVMEWLSTEYLGQVTAVVLPIVEQAAAAQLITTSSPILTAQSLSGPMIFHWLSRPLLQAAGVPLAQKDDVCAAFAHTFCQGVTSEVHA